MALPDETSPADHFLIVILRSPEWVARGFLRWAEGLAKGWGALFSIKLIFLLGGVGAFLFALWGAFLWPIARHLERDLIPALRVLTIVVLAVYVDAVVRVIEAGVDSALTIEPADRVIWLAGFCTAALDRVVAGPSAYAA